MDNLNNNTPKESIKPKISYIFDYYTIFYLCFSLVVFIIPKDILDTYPICQEFVTFMKQYFPNIEIFSNVSRIPQVVEFYTSLMWVVGLVFSVAMFILTFGAVIANKNKSKNIRLSNFENFFLWMGSIVMSWWSFKVYYTGYIVTNGVSFGARDFDIVMNTRFEAFIPIVFFQFTFVLGFMSLGFALSVLYINFRQNKIN